MIEDTQWTESYKTYAHIFKKMVTEMSWNKKFHDVENELFDDIMELGRQMLQEHLDARGNGDVGKSIIRADGKMLSHKREGSCQLTTQFGKVNVHPQGYGQRGENRLFPLKETLSLPARSFSYPVQKKVCFEAIKGPYSKVTETLDDYTKAHVSKQQVEHIVNDAAQDFDDFYTRSPQEPTMASPDIIVATADGKGIVMRQADLREATRQRCQSQKLKHRQSKGEKRNRKRMATVASVYNIAPHKRDVNDVMNEIDRKANHAKRPRPEHKRVWASVKKTPEEVFEELAREVERRLDTGKIAAFLSDGEKNLKRLAKKVLKPCVAKSGTQFFMILDIIHAIEYLWKAAHVFHKEGSQDSESFVEKYLRWMLEGKVGQVAAAIGRSATRLGIEGDKREVVDKVSTYFKNNKESMRYETYLALGLPIATGVIEGACKSLVRDRFEVTGARWGLGGAESLLKLRAIYQSQDWDEYWDFHIKQEGKRLYPKGQWRIEGQGGKPELRVIHGDKSS